MSLCHNRCLHISWLINGKQCPGVHRLALHTIYLVATCKQMASKTFPNGRAWLAYYDYELGKLIRN